MDIRCHWLDSEIPDFGVWVVRSSNLEDKLAFGFWDSLMFKVFSDLGIVEKQFYNL